MDPAIHSSTLEWLKTIWTMLFSWPVVGFLGLLVFRKPLVGLIEQFTKGDLRRAKIGPIEIERELNKLAEQGQQAVSSLNRINELMAESRLLELEITQTMFGRVFTNEQHEKLKGQIEEFRMLTTKGAE
jgi:hypothetical protein